MCSVDGLRGIQAMTDLAITGALVTEFIPLPLADVGPEKAARLVLALLNGRPGACLPPATSRA
jgi:hypothetical protein